MEISDADVILRNEYSNPYHNCPVLDRSTKALQTDTGAGMNIGFVNVDATCHIARKHKINTALRSSFPNFIGIPHRLHCRNPATARLIPSMRPSMDSMVSFRSSLLEAI